MATSKKPAPAAVNVSPAAVAPAASKPPAAKKVASKAVATKAPAAKKPEAKADAPAAKAAKKAPAKKIPKPSPVVEGPSVDATQRANYIEVAAYYIAQRRGFTPGDPQQDYLDAAAEIDQLIAAGHFGK